MLIRMRSYAGVSQVDVPRCNKTADLVSESRQPPLDIGHVDTAMPKIAADRPEVDKDKAFWIFWHSSGPRGAPTQ